VVKRDWIAVAGLLAAAVAIVRWRANFSLSPVEDAAMLLRYSENLAGGHGIVWNVGERPEDGATDFLFMLLVAVVRRFGAGLEQACHLVGLGFHLATIATVYWAVRAVARASRTVAFLGAAYVAVGPGLRYIEGGFGTTVFAFFVALSAATWIALSQSPNRPALAYRFAFSCLAMGLARPEGVALALLLAVSLAALIDPRCRAAVAIRFGLAFGVPGSMYFLWHWAHFGHPLANPMYVRSVHGGHVTSLRDAVKNAIRLLLPVAPMVVLGAWRGARRVTAALMFPTAGFVALWIAMSHSMNFMMRYQYALVPLAIVMWAPTTTARLVHLGAAQKWILLGASIVPALFVLAYVHEPIYQMGGAGWRNIGLALSKFSHGHTIVTTEAGQLPLYSGWRAVDAGGLNDSWIAHHGLTDEYLEQNHPALIVVAPASPLARRWREMTTHLQAFATSRHYVLAAVFGSCHEAPVEFYVAPWLPESAAVVEQIQRADPGMPKLDLVTRAAPAGCR
jgi:arabinofuranosyltransferase